MVQPQKVLFWFSLCVFFGDPKNKTTLRLLKVYCTRTLPKTKNTRVVLGIWCLVLPLQTFAFRKFMNAPSTLYSAQNPEIAFANVCKGLQTRGDSSRFKIYDSRFKIHKPNIKYSKWWICVLCASFHLCFVWC